VYVVTIPIRKKKKRTIRDIIRRRLFAGIVVIVPIGITIMVLQFLYDLTAGRLTPITKLVFEPLPDYIVPIGSTLFLVVITYAIGLVASVVIGRKVIGLAEMLLEYIPVVKTVYGASKQAVHVLSDQDATTNYESAVIVDFPRPGMKALAFVTGKVQIEVAGDAMAREHYSVFIPTTPNPTSGYLEFVPVSAVESSSISVEDAIKSIMSGGLIIPDGFGPSRDISGKPVVVHHGEGDSE
jgi:uncharacterized membrane protein